MLSRNGTASPGVVLPAARAAVTRQHLMLAALVLGAFLLRCHRLFADPVWIDEAASIGIGTLPWSVVFGEMARIEASPPGYYAIAKLAGLVAGPQVEPLRLLSAAAAALSVVPVWLLCRSAFGLRAAWLAAGILALHATLLRLAQDGRTYTVLFLVFCCALLAAWRLVEAARRGEGGLGALLALGFCQGVMLWLHHTAGIANLGLNVFVVVALLGGRQGLGRGLALLAGADLLGLLAGGPPILWAASHAVEGAFVTRWIAPPTWEEALLIYARALVAPFQSPVSEVTGLVSAAAVAAGMLARRRPGWPERLGLFALLAFAALAFPLVSQHWPVMLDRTVLFMAAPLAASIAAGLVLLGTRTFALAAAVLLGLHAYGAAGWFGLPVHKEEWHRVAATLRERHRPGDRIVVADSVFAAISLRMRFEADGERPPPMLVVPAISPLETRSAALLAPEASVTVEGLCARLRGAGSVWLIARPPPPVVQDDPGFSTWEPVRAVLRRAGGTLAERLGPPTVDVERWVVPRC